jgi:hypothetical protein
MLVHLSLGASLVVLDAWRWSELERVNLLQDMVE